MSTLLFHQCAAALMFGRVLITCVFTSLKCDLTTPAAQIIHKVVRVTRNAILGYQIIIVIWLSNEWNCSGVMLAYASVSVIVRAQSTSRNLNIVILGYLERCLWYSQSSHSCYYLLGCQASLQIAQSSSTTSASGSSSYSGMGQGRATERRHARSFY